MASQIRIHDVPPPRFDAALAAQASRAEPSDEIVDAKPWTTSAQSPYELPLFDRQSLASRSASNSAEHVPLGANPSGEPPPSRPVSLPTVSRYNESLARPGRVTVLGRPLPVSTLPTAHISGRAMLLAGTETLTNGLLRGSRPGVVGGALLLAGGAGAATAAVATAQAALRHRGNRYGAYFGVTGFLGVAALAGGGFMRQYARFHDHEIFAIGAMVALGVGAAEAALSGALAFAAAESETFDAPSQKRAAISLWSLDAGVVTTMTYGLATRLNGFPPLADNAIMGTAYTASMAGIVWQYADGAWFKRANIDVSPHLRTTWTPTALIGLAFVSKMMVLVGIKLAVDGFVQENLAFNASGTLLTIAAFVLVCVPQLSYFHPDLKASKHAPAWPVTLAVIGGAILLAAGSGLREWAGLNHKLPIARGAMALAAAGALSVVACSSLSLAASEIERGRAPLRHRPEVALGMQVFGVAIGVAYGLGIRMNQYNPLIDDAMLATSYLTVGIGGAMSYASSQLDRATFNYLQDNMPLQERT